MSFLLSFVVALLCGILSGFGIGGGTLLIIAMTVFMGIPQLTAQGINLLYFIPTAGASLFGHIKNRLIDKTAFLWTAGCGLVTTVLSSLLLSSVDPGISRKIFGVFLLAVGFAEIFVKKKR